MKTNKKASKALKENSIVKQIRDFVTINAFVLVLLIAAVWAHQVFIVGAKVDTLVENQNNMITYLKENINKVYFLSASGMAISVEKSDVSYADERFKSYVSNEIVSKLIAGNVIISSNYKLSYASPTQLLQENKNINNFFRRFVRPNGSVIAPYARALHRAIVEGKYPEYISVVSHSYRSYMVRQPSEDTNYKTVIDATIKLTLIVKSWIRDLKEWDTREVEINIPYSAIIDTQKYVNISNPFGIHFTKIAIPIIHKPTGTEIMEGRR